MHWMALKYNRSSAQIFSQGFSHHTSAFDLQTVQVVVDLREVLKSIVKNFDSSWPASRRYGLNDGQVTERVGTANLVSKTVSFHGSRNRSMSLRGLQISFGTSRLKRIKEFSPAECRKRNTEFASKPATNGRSIELKPALIYKSTNRR